VCLDRDLFALASKQQTSTPSAKSCSHSTTNLKGW
jgi:hypothetical protein